MTTTPLPRKPTGKLAFAYQSIAALEQARADLEAENQRLREALKAILDEQDANQGHATLETYDAARAALEKQP